MQIQDDATVGQQFYAPLIAAFQACPQRRECPSYSDLDHAACAVGRVLENAASGRDWVQQAQAMGEPVSVSRFFDALSSPTRTGRLGHVALELREMARGSAQPSNDPLAAHRELDGYSVWATDGHCLAASSHEDPIEGRIRPHTHIFSLDLRSHAASHVDLCWPKEGMKKEHEIKALKRLPAKALRMGERKGRKVVHCYDPAIVDYRFWARAKQLDGVYFITREKSNSALDFRRALPWDRTDPRNNGVVYDEVAASREGFEIRRVIYVDPVRNKLYVFLTTEMALPPGIVAYLYKLRWDVEKFFDQSKNAFAERRAWAKSPSSKRQQALFIAMAHNLCLIFERMVERDEGIVDVKSQLKRAGRRAAEIAEAGRRGNAFNAAVAQCSRITKRSLQFIRWLRHSLRAASAWRPAIEALRPLMLKYIQ